VPLDLANRQSFWPAPPYKWPTDSSYVRTVRTSSGAVAVQVVWKSSRGSRDIQHLGSAHTDAEVELLKAVAIKRIAAGQDKLPLDVAAHQEPSAFEIVSSRMGRLLDAIAG
jgi:hypothetical protein